MDLLFEGRLNHRGTLLFALNNEGRIFGLSTYGTKWREFAYLGLEFKQLSAVPNFLWAVGSDRQIYVHAYGLDIPIRVKEEVYENERWTPFRGFTNKLLPTDRFNFSNIDGTIERNLETISLPSRVWQWEDDWKLELTLDGQLLDYDGWTYAVDFSATYYPIKYWSSNVRRRKWVRYRKYIALNTWCAIAPLHRDPTQDPFIGVSVGGNQLPGGNIGTMLVWAVTANGRLVFRTKVSSTSPEGQRWVSVFVPNGCEVSQVSVGVTGLVWVVLRNGEALVRTGITKDCVTGIDWLKVLPPRKESLLNQVSVGYNGVWTITRDYGVWFRKGIQGDSSGVSEISAKGTDWVEIGGHMSSISVATNDQVWAVGANDKVLYFRTSVTQKNLTGETWCALNATTQLSRANSSLSFMTKEMEGTLNEKRYRSLNQLSGSPENKPKIKPFYFNDTSHSAPTMAHNVWQKSTNIVSPRSFSSIASPGSDSLATSLQNSWRNFSGVSSNFNESLQEKIIDVKEYMGRSEGESSSTYENVSHLACSFLSKEVAVPTCSRSYQYAGETVAGTEAHYAIDHNLESNEISGIYSEYGEREGEEDYLYWADSKAFWSTVEAGACFINVNHLPNWFLKPWRMKILNGLKRRSDFTNKNVENYEKVVGNFTKVEKCKCLLPRESSYKECLIELKWNHAEKDCSVWIGTLTVFDVYQIESWAQISLKKIKAVINCSAPLSPRLALYYSSPKPLILQFSGENECEEWKSELSSICSQIRNTVNSPSSNSIWATTALGDIYVCDLSQVEVDRRISKSNAHTIELTLTGSNMPVDIPLQAGFLPGSSLIFCGRVHDDAESFFIDLLCRDDNGFNNVAFHYNPRFSEKVIVCNTKKNSTWGEENIFLDRKLNRGREFEIEINCKSNCFEVFFNSEIHTKFKIRENSTYVALTPPFITHLSCGGDITLCKILYSANEVILEPMSLFWRQIDGHLKKVETSGEVTWGIGFDNTAWIYLDSGRRSVHDTRYYYVYENQRWMPFTGYSSHLLPTDRFAWSDVTGMHEITREKTLLPSKQWRWVNEWRIDFHTPGGVDKEGWQYALDFVWSYHDKQLGTDYVRRRRWFRCARLETEGPWMELGNTPLVDCSLFADEADIRAWAVAANGHVLFRRGVSKTCPAGLLWEYIASDEQMISISCWLQQVWAVGKSGAVFYRKGISRDNPTGDCWVSVEAVTGTQIKQITIGERGTWVVDSSGGISVKTDVFGDSALVLRWKTLPLLSNKPESIDNCVLPGSQLTLPSKGFRQVISKNKLWAVTNSGWLVFRLATNQHNYMGSLWLTVIEANFLHVSL